MNSTGTHAGRTRPASLTLRLSVAIFLIISAGGVLVTYAALAFGQQAARNAFDRLLVGAADQISSSIFISDGEVLVDLPVPALELLGLAGDDRVAYRVVDPDGNTLTGYNDLDLPDFSGDIDFFDGTFTGEPARFVAVRRHFAERAFSGTVTTIVGHTKLAREALAWEIARSAWIVLGLAGLAMAALAVFAIRSALSPLRRIERDLIARDPNDLTPIDVAVPREIQASVGAINRFMARLRRQIEGMQHLIADSAHQLRTPIAGLRAQAELAREEEDPARQAEIVEKIHRRSLGLSRLTDQLLNRALVIHRGDTAPRETVDLRRIAIAASEEFDDGTMFETQKLRLDLPESPVATRGDAFSLTEAAKNLISNALNHGEGTVTVRVTRAGARVRLTVADEGRGMSEAEIGMAGSRFEGRGGSRRQSTGVGLAIVRAVALAHGGALEIAPDRARGFAISLVLPAIGDR